MLPVSKLNHTCRRGHQNWPRYVKSCLHMHACMPFFKSHITYYSVGTTVQSPSIFLRGWAQSLCATSLFWYVENIDSLTYVKLILHKQFVHFPSYRANWVRINGTKYQLSFAIVIGGDSEEELNFGSVVAIYADGQSVIFEFFPMLTHNISHHHHAYALKSPPLNVLI